MTEPTAEQVDREMEAATVPILGVEFTSAAMLTLVHRQIATALARVRIEAHAAGRDEGLLNCLAIVLDTTSPQAAADAIRALRGKS